MSGPLIAAGLWVAAAAVLAMLPTQDGHRKRATALIAGGVPLLGWLTVAHGPVLGGAALAAGTLILRLHLLRPGTGARVRPKVLRG